MFLPFFFLSLGCLAGNIPQKRTNDKGQGTRVFFQPSGNSDQCSDLGQELDGAIQINVSDGSESGSSDGMDVSGEEFEIVDATFKEIIVSSLEN